MSALSMLSVVVITKNEEKQIAKCLETCRFADEIIVVDDFSTDKTCQIARKCNAKVYLRRLDSIAKQADFGYSKAKGEWILAIAADERISFKLSQEILRAIKSKEYDGYNFYFQSFLFGKALGSTQTDGQVRLFKKNKGYITKERIHEKIRVKRGKIGQLKNPILHYSYPSVFGVVEKFNRYTNPESYLAYKRGERTNLFKISVAVPRVFFWRYLVAGEWRDGKRGFILSFLFGIYHLLWQLKLWEIQNRQGGDKFATVKFVPKH